METVCFEMAEYVSRTATTPILNQSNERNATVLDAQGRLAALSVGIPQFMLTSTLPVRFALEFLGVDEFREGDVFVANDPYHGGGHLPDYNVFAPVFADDPSAPGGRRMVLIASIQCHHGDTGGGVPGGYNITATDIWGEGVRWPVVKVIDRGVERRDVLYALQANNRIPSYIGDLRAQIGAAQLGAQRLGEIIERYGADDGRGVGRLHDRLRGAPLPRGGRAVARRRVRSRRVRRPRSARQPRHPPAREGHRRTATSSRSTSPAPTLAPELQAWSTFGNTRGYTVGQIAAMMDPEIPKNEGFFEQIKLIVPKGCVLNPDPGKPVTRRYAPPGRRRRRGDRGRDAVRAPRARPCRRPTRPASPRSSSASTRAPARRSPTTRPRSTRAGATRRRAWTRGARSTRASATSGRPPPRSTSRSTRTSSGAATTAPTPAAPDNGAASAAATTRRKCASTPRSTRTSSA